MEDRIIELETKLAYQEDLLQQLNLVLTEYGTTLTRLSKKVETLEESLKEFNQNNLVEGEQEKPPHY